MGVKRIGVDVGGTFTDVVMLDEDGRMNVAKVSTTVENPASGVLAGINRLETNLSRIGIIVHGTTVATNTLLEKKGGKTGLITTRGFRDILEIRRGFRPPPPYDLLKELLPPLVPRPLRLEVEERIDPWGEIIAPLNLEDVYRSVHKLKSEGVEAIAVCLFFSFVNDLHERRIKEIIQREFPGCVVSISSEVLPMIREYERTSVTVINAYLAPRVSGYIGSLIEELQGRGYEHDFLLVRASGGVISAAAAIDRPVHLIAGGPAAGVIAALNIAREAGYGNIVTIDTGGTSCDVGLVIKSEPCITKDKIYTYQLAIPMIDVTSIGTGGGSIAWIDRGGALQVGPESAGAVPGPACYGLGGTEPTLTDADLLLGYLNPDNFLGGEIKLNRDLSSRAIEKVARHLGMGMTEAALGIFRTANVAMTEEARLRIVEHGYDPRDFALFTYGGAGPVHAGQLAEDLYMRQVIIPMHPGLVSAMGCLLADLKYDYVQSFIRRTSETALDPATNARFNDLLSSMERQGVERLKKEGVKDENIIVNRTADMRYPFQTHEIRIPLPLGTIGKKEMAEIEKRFHQEHERIYTFQNPNDPIEFAELFVTAIGLIPKPQWETVPEGGESPPPGARRGERPVFFEQYNGFSPTPVFDRPQLRAGNRIEGPAIIEEMDSTTVIYPSQMARVDRLGNIIIDINI